VFVFSAFNVPSNGSLTFCTFPLTSITNEATGLPEEVAAGMTKTQSLLLRLLSLGSVPHLGNMNSRSSVGSWWFRL
jgi:hypothetical protein